MTVRLELHFTEGRLLKKCLQGKEPTLQSHQYYKICEHYLKESNSQNGYIYTYIYIMRGGQKYGNALQKLYNIY